MSVITNLLTINVCQYYKKQQLLDACMTINLVTIVEQHYKSFRPDYLVLGTLSSLRVPGYEANQELYQGYIHEKPNGNFY